MLTKEVIKEKLQKALPQFKKRFPIERLALFGSYARGDQRADSDIDILVEFNGEIGWEFFDLADEIEKILGSRVQLVSRKGIKPHYWEYIEEDVIYV